MDLQHLFRPDFGQLDKYTPVKPLEVLAEEIGVSIESLVKLDANENLYCCPQEVLEAMTKSYVHIYPDPSATHFCKAISSFLSIPSECIVGGSGSDDLIDILMRLVMPTSIVTASPTFGMYSYLGKVLGNCKIIDVPRIGDNFTLDVDGIIAAIRREHDQSASRVMVFIASPNNPTGSSISLCDVVRLCNEKCIVVIDEAYAEFSPCPSTVALRQEAVANKVAAAANDKELANLITLRTFSKWAALAGLRVGYGIAHPAFCEGMMAVKQPYNVSAPASAAVCCALSQPVFGKIMGTVEAIKQEKGNLYDLLAQYEWLHTLPSDANFILMRVEGLNRKNNAVVADAVVQTLRKNGILVRYYRTPALQQYIRISVGRPEDTARLKAGLDLVDLS